ncbi:MAG: hypothetical protein L0I62_02355 [Gammaproteobacteria bacterium]|nr:hypothetical protein [Gammaproteobacteria bacterium]
MATRLNYTRRKRLALDKLNISVRPVENESATFDADLNLADLRPEYDDARVFVEAYRQSTRMRFDWGTVGNIVPPPTTDRRLTEFDDWRRVRFRLKITDMTHEPGKLIAWRNQIRPKGPEDEHDNDLLFFENADLEGRVWNLRFEDDLGPVVQIDEKAGDRYDVGSDPKFQAAVFPEVMRRTLIQAFVVEEENGDDEQHWSFVWLQGFLKPQLKMSDPPPLEEGGLSGREEWIEEAVRLFAKRNDLNLLWNPEAGGQG